MERLIGDCTGGFLTDAQRREIEATAARYGFVFRSINVDDDDELARCEVIFGYVAPSRLKAATSLRWLQTAFAGVESVTSPELYARPNVILTNAAGAFGVTISEHLIATALMLLRGMPDYVLRQQRGEWIRRSRIRSIYGSKVTVVGLGDIGTEFARRVHALGAEVTGVRRRARPAPEYVARVLTSDRLDEALPGADIVALCLPATSETERIIDARRLALLPSHAILLNVGRGSVIDEDALCDALNADLLGGAALDVFTWEPLPASHPLWRAKNCLITPHVSGATSLPETGRRIAGIFLENLPRYAKGEPLAHVVDRASGY